MTDKIFRGECRVMKEQEKELLSIDLIKKVEEAIKNSEIRVELDMTQGGYKNTRLISAHGGYNIVLEWIVPKLKEY